MAYNRFFFLILFDLLNPSYSYILVVSKLEEQKVEELCVHVGLWKRFLQHFPICGCCVFADRSSLKWSAKKNHAIGTLICYYLFIC